MVARKSTGYHSGYGSRRQEDSQDSSMEARDRLDVRVRRRYRRPCEHAAYCFYRRHLQRLLGWGR